MCRSLIDFEKSEKAPKETGGYGTFHACLRIDGELVYVSVIDVLPNYLSSVYLFYDQKYRHLNLGILSALKEIEWVQKIQKNGFDFFLTALLFFDIVFYFLVRRETVWRSETLNLFVIARLNPSRSFQSLYRLSSSDYLVYPDLSKEIGTARVRNYHL